ncbi:ABC transporter permease [Flaviflexus ciconiae]|uniref:ABC transporter permease n=1 Tax=Flaviflexus ciconiae TaxID=2496867 RepID=A0A3Q9G5P9_9ACTO|nr:ABC transporter permease [Flaviflexus ciconiae]AZQ77985.1 ABC transporter permease [Flaviflexus ciconiae]
MSPIFLVARREFIAQTRSKALIISTVVMAVLILAAGVLGRFLLEPDDNPDQIVATVGVTNSASPLTEDLEAAGLTVIDVQGPAEDILTANEDLNAVIAAEPSRPQIFALDNAEHLDFITEATESAAGSYVLTDTFGDQATPEAKAYLADAQNLSVEIFSANEFDPIAFIVGLITVSLVYGVIVMGVSMLATGVVEEKSSRVVEILLATIKPRDLLMGKFLGIGGAIFLMVAVYTAAIVGAGAIAGILPDINITTYVPMLLLWVVLGYIIYASITGGLAATVSRQEDIGAITTPIIFLSIVPFYFAMFYVPNSPDSTLTQIIGFIPFFSPFLLPIRSAITEVPMSDVLISVGICLVTIPILATLAGKIYERSILHTGTRMKLTEVFKKS